MTDTYAIYNTYNNKFLCRAKSEFMFSFFNWGEGTVVLYNIDDLETMMDDNTNKVKYFLETESDIRVDIVFVPMGGDLSVDFTKAISATSL